MILKEYAVDPTCIGDWHLFRYLIESFGVPRGRLIAKYPSKWLQMVYASCGSFTFQQKQKLEIELTRIKKYGLSKTSRTYDGNFDWLENALAQHEIKPFYAIISEKDDINHQVLAVSEITEVDPLWGIQRTMVVPRNAESMAAAVSTLLVSSQHIVLIDPHFGPENIRHRRPLQAFLRAAVENRSARMPEIEIHTQVKSSKEFFREQCQNRLTPLIPADLKVRFVRWTVKPDGQPLHNRYILTDLGGVSFQHGLDDDRNREGATDDIALLDRDSYEQRWAEYVGENPAFDLCEEPFELVGR